MMATTAMVAAAMAVDALLGEPRRWHPLVGFGRMAARIEQAVHGAGDLAPGRQRRRGVVAVMMATIPCIGLTALASSVVWLAPALGLTALYLAVGRRSLMEHAHPVHQALRASDLVSARDAVGRIVSRDTRQSPAPAVAAATVESVLENGNDAVFAAMFWFALGGAAGVVAYRLVNTLDAMWGYRNVQYRDFGWAAARLDDVLNWIPARLTALTYALLGNWRTSWFCWRTQGRQWKSPNAGPVMAAGAGSLAVVVGGPAIYDGQIHDRPRLGVGHAAEAADIPRAMALVNRGVLLWLAVMALLEFGYARLW